MEGICATNSLRIQALKLYIFYYIDIYLKDVILVLSWVPENSNKNKMPVKYQSSSILYNIPDYHIRLTFK